MTTKLTEKTHWCKVDYRVDSLYQIIMGLENSIVSLKQRVDEYGYNVIDFDENSEPIYGLAFIAFQNYINGSIKDLYETTSSKTTYYKIDSNLMNFHKSSIELIIGLANFIKHKDDDELRKGTKDILDCFDLKYVDNDIINSPIFEGLSLLNKDWDLFEILKIVTNWRKKLFENYNST